MKKPAAKKAAPTKKAMGGMSMPMRGSPMAMRDMPMPMSKGAGKKMPSFMAKTKMATGGMAKKGKC